MRRDWIILIFYIGSYLGLFRLRTFYKLCLSESICFCIVTHVIFCFRLCDISVYVGSVINRATCNKFLVAKIFLDVTTLADKKTEF